MPDGALAGVKTGALGGAGQTWLFRVDAEGKIPAFHQADVLRAQNGRPHAYLSTFTVGYLGLQVLGRRIVETRGGGIILDQVAITPPVTFRGNIITGLQDDTGSGEITADAS